MFAKTTMRGIVRRFAKFVKQNVSCIKLLFMKTRAEMPLESAFRHSLSAFMRILLLTDSRELRKAGIYAQKMTRYRRGANLPNSVCLIAALFLLKYPLEVTDPATGKTWVLRWHRVRRKPQLPLPLAD